MNSKDMVQTQGFTAAGTKPSTAGPWRIEGRRGPGYIISAGVNAEGDGPAEYVGVIDPMFYVAGEDTAKHEANAQLIVSAPEMAALLGNLLACNIINGVTEEVTAGARRAVRDLLAKACQPHCPDGAAGLRITPKPFAETPAQASEGAQ